MSRADGHSIAHQRSRRGFGWDVLVKLDGDELETHYADLIDKEWRRSTPM